MANKGYVAFTERDRKRVRELSKVYTKCHLASMLGYNGGTKSRVINCLINGGRCCISADKMARLHGIKMK